MPRRVLVVDDLQPNVMVIEKALTTMGYDVVGAVVHTADEALSVIVSFKFDYLILDINLTGEPTDSSGITVAEKAIEAGVERTQIILHSDSETARKYWANKLGVHESTKLDIPSIVDCINGECSHRLDQERL